MNKYFKAMTIINIAILGGMNSHKPVYTLREYLTPPIR